MRSLTVALPVIRLPLLASSSAPRRMMVYDCVASSSPQRYTFDCGLVSEQKYISFLIKFMSKETAAQFRFKPG